MVGSGSGRGWGGCNCARSWYADDKRGARVCCALTSSGKQFIMVEFESAASRPRGQRMQHSVHPPMSCTGGSTDPSHDLGRCTSSGRVPCDQHNHCLRLATRPAHGTCRKWQSVDRPFLVTKRPVFACLSKELRSQNRRQQLVLPQDRYQ